MKHIHHSDQSAYWHQSQREKSADGHPSAPAGHSTQTGIKAKPSHDEVARNAYEIYLKEGCPQGRDVQHWLMAEAHMSV
jgi:hypothetical protein